jgi:hypothetical protein
VTMVFYSKGPSQDDGLMGYTWADPTGDTPSCSGVLRRALR